MAKILDTTFDVTYDVALITNGMDLSYEVIAALDPDAMSDDDLIDFEMEHEEATWFLGFLDREQRITDALEEMGDEGYALIEDLNGTGDVQTDQTLKMRALGIE